jgi:hypothetical protein
MRFATPLRVTFALSLLAACSASAPSAPEAMSVLDLGMATTAPRPTMMDPRCFPDRAVAFPDTLRMAQHQALSVSPTGRFRVVAGASPVATDLPGVAIADLSTDRAQVWSSVEPVMWDAQTDKLVVRDRAGGLFATTGLDQPFVRVDVQPSAISPLLYGADGVLFFGEDGARGANEIRIQPLAGKEHRLKLPRPIADAGVACSGPSACIPYVEYEDREQGGGFRRYAVAVSNGRETVFSIDGYELDFVGLGPDARFAVALARRGTWRSLWIVAANGAIELASGILPNHDYVRAVIDRDGVVAAAETFSGGYVEQGAVAPTDVVNRLWRVTPTGKKIYQSRVPGDPASLTVVDPAGRVAMSGFACSSNPVLVGKALQPSGPSAARGAYFLPAGPMRGLVAYFPGGEYRAFAGYADILVATLLEEGFGVVVVQARGRPGFGSPVLYSKDGSLDDKSAADAADLLEQVVGRERLRTDIPRWAVGVSAGSRPALAALMSQDPIWSGGLVLAGACVKEEERPALMGRRRTPSYSLVAEGLRSKVASCAGRVPEGRAVLVAHGLKDLSAEPQDMQQLVAGNPGSTRGYWLKDRGHDLTAGELVDVIRRAVGYWSETAAGRSPPGASTKAAVN